jgi:UTP--glucose-1-phosphate uridylyltransferase
VINIKKAVIPAAGWGTRFLPVTKSQAKEMLPLVDKPTIQYSIEEAVNCGIETVVIVTTPRKRAIEDYFNQDLELEHLLEQKGEAGLVRAIRRLSSMVDICYVQQEKQLGLGHAVLSTKKAVGNEPFLLFLPDDIFQYGTALLKKMLDIYQRYQGCVLAIKEVSDEEVSRYGIVEAEPVDERIYHVANMVEKPLARETRSRLAIMGRYILTPEIFSALEGTQPGKNGEIQITDAIKQLLQNSSIHAYEFEGERYDSGTPFGWLQTTIALALQRPDIGPQLRRYLYELLEQDVSGELLPDSKAPALSLNTHQKAGSPAYLVNFRRIQ